MTAVPNTTKVVVDTESTTADELADATVRHLGHLTAEATTRHLRSQRFLAAHDAAVDGIAETVSALRDASADVILVHDDPEDQRELWFGPGTQDIASEEAAGFTRARLVDVIIRSAILQQIPVKIIPSTGPSGPDDNTAAVKAETIDTTPF